MADVADKAKPKKIHRLQIGLNVLVQLILIFFLVTAVNWIGFRHYKRWDVSRDQKYALSDKTKRFLNSIKGKVRITVFFSPSTPISGDVSSLLTEYQYAAKGKIDIENIDPQRSLSRAKELFDKYKVVSDESLIVIDYEGRNKTVKASEMAEIRTGDHECDDGFGRRKKEHDWICDWPQRALNRRTVTAWNAWPTTAARGQSDFGAEDVHRERKH